MEEYEPMVVPPLKVSTADVIIRLSTAVDHIRNGYPEESIIAIMELVADIRVKDAMLAARNNTENKGE